MLRTASKMATVKTAGSLDSVDSSVDGVDSSVDGVDSSVDDVDSSVDGVGSSGDSLGMSIDGIGSNSAGGDHNSDEENGGKQAATTTVHFGPPKTSMNLVIPLCNSHLSTYTRKQNQHRCLTSCLIRSLVRHLEAMVLQLHEFQ